MLHGFLEKPEKFLWTILVGNTLVNFIVLGWMLAKLHEWFTGPTGWLDRRAVHRHRVFVLRLFRSAAEDVVSRVSEPLVPARRRTSSGFVHLALGPVVFLVEGVSQLVLRWRGSRAFTGRLFGNREEMRAVMAEAAQALTGEEHAMVNRVLDLQHFTVGQIAVPLEKTFSARRADAVARGLGAGAGKKSFAPAGLGDARRQTARRRPAGRDGAAVPRSLDLAKTAGEFMSPALFLDDSTRLEIALRRMQRAGQRLAIVLARDGREAGVVSLEDILKLMFGEVKL